MVVSERLNKTIVIAAKTADFNHFNVMLARFNNVGVNTESTIYENRKYRRSSPGLSIAVSNATGRFFVGTSAYNPEPPERRFAVVRFYDTVFLPDPNFGDPNGFASASFPGLDVLPMDMSVDVLNNMPVVGGSVLP
jgi:hypothetical protein